MGPAPVAAAAGDGSGTAAAAFAVVEPAAVGGGVVVRGIVSGDEGEGGEV